MKKIKVSDEEITQIKSLNREGKSITKIAKILNRSYSTIYDYHVLFDLPVKQPGFNRPNQIWTSKEEIINQLRSDVEFFSTDDQYSRGRKDEAEWILGKLSRKKYDKH